MNTPTSHVSIYGRYVGRVGALAAALGIGVIVATAPGIATADPSGSTGDTSSSSSDTAGVSSAATGAAATESAPTAAGTDVPDSSDNASAATSSTASEASASATAGATASTTQVAPGVTVSSSGGAQTSSGDATTPLDPAPGGETVVGAPPDDATSNPEATTPTAEAPDSAQPTVANNQSDSGPTDMSGGTTTRSVLRDTSSAATSVRAAVASEPPTFASFAASETQDVSTGAARSAITVTTLEAVTSAAPSAASPVIGVVRFLNSVVANLLTPFLSPVPNTTDPLTPVVWAVFAFVRRNFFNEAPTITYNPTQTGQTVTGTLATDPEGDALTYMVTGGTQVDQSTWVTDTGKLTINQSTGVFTYTPDDIDYGSVQTDSFTVSVTDGKTNLLSLFGAPHSHTETISILVQPPTVERVILNMPPGITKPVNPRYAEGGQSIVFAGTPAAGGRQEIYQIDIDGTDAKCLTCGLVAPAVAATNPASPINIQKPVPFYDGTGRIVVLLNNPEPRYAIFEPAGYNGVGSAARLVNVVTPDGGGATLPGVPYPGGIINREREMRPSPDGTHVLFTRIVLGQTGNFQALPIVGEFVQAGDHYEVANARVVWPTGEGKQWTPDGKGVVIQGGAFEAGNVDDIMVDLSGETGTNLYPGSPFRGTRVTGNLDYDEDMDFSPNMQWITVGSTRGFDALTPMTRIVRQNFLPFYVGAAIYDQYADGQVRNVSNQNWAVALEDDLNRENGIPLFVQDDPATPGVDEGDGWISRSMPSWNPDGTAVTFWESGNGDEHGIAPTESRLVVANLKYTTSVGPVADTATVFDPSAFPELSTYVAKTTPLPPTGSYNGVGGGTAVVSEDFNSTTFQTKRTVQYINYVNEDGLILNGTESSTYGPSQTRVTYIADIDVTDAAGANRGGLEADAVYTLLPTQSVTGYIRSTLDGDTQTIPDPTKVEDAKTGA